MRALNSLFVRSNARQRCEYVSAAVQVRPDLADRIVAAALNISRSDRRPTGTQISCEESECIIQAAIEANPAATREIVDAAVAAAPELRDCIVAAANVAQACQVANAFVQPTIISTINPANFAPAPVVSPEQPTQSSGE
jgi:hypothetical protein